jgi:hypothetical protein
MLHFITDFIGIFFERIEVGKKMSLKTPSGKVRNFDTNSKNCKAQYTKKYFLADRECRKSYITSLSPRFY